uniref:glycogenin glucosyltransferase n=1 Tax=Hemiscolopendra marginata TaxID=943146 RepID=A0A646QIE1_9MYRI
MASPVTNEAWVTLATNDSYAVGALVLGHSLRRASTNRQLAVIITPDVTQGMREQLNSVYDHISAVDVLDSNDDANLALLKRPELGITFTKIHCWRLTQYTKCVFLDADTLVLLNCDELFERDELSAAADIGWPDCFNSGVFVYTPSNETFNSILNFALENGSFDGGDQGLLNMYFHDWATKDIRRHLPFTYNMTSNATYTYQPAYHLFGRNVRIVHFIGSLKPWMQGYNSLTHKVELREGTTHAIEHLQAWWDIFIADVQHRLQPSYAGLAGQLALMVVAEDVHIAADERARQLAWESGHIDYMGQDAFENIQRKLDQVINENSKS